MSGLNFINCDPTAGDVCLLKFKQFLVWDTKIFSLRGHLFARISYWYFMWEFWRTMFTECTSFFNKSEILKSRHFLLNCLFWHLQFWNSWMLTDGAYVGEDTRTIWGIILKTFLEGVPTKG